MPNSDIYHLLIAARNALEEAYWKNYNDVLFTLVVNDDEKITDNEVLKMLTEEYIRNNEEFKERIGAEWNKLNP